ncbi:hypothetical protein C8Q73DRAFT_97317 [Cubamyces lactineus]|nr:hypothetical protein C8Q73DRAFT_97317 [Cubamyces lactineus]
MKHRARPVFPSSSHSCAAAADKGSTVSSDAACPIQTRAKRDTHRSNAATADSMQVRSSRCSSKPALSVRRRLSHSPGQQTSSCVRLCASRTSFVSTTSIRSCCRPASCAVTRTYQRQRQLADPYGTLRTPHACTPQS